ncbi:hypothetical protein BDR06DRAFT_337562 [Suillus hirtellus]|nr:hypothetical protein BDR06DRAFT_337562 [Suillus hirtellus]
MEEAGLGLVTSGIDTANWAEQVSVEMGIERLLEMLPNTQDIAMDSSTTFDVDADFSDALVWDERPINIIGLRDISINDHCYCLSHPSHHSSDSSSSFSFIKLSMFYLSPTLLALFWLLLVSSPSSSFLYLASLAFVTHPHLPTPTPTSDSFVPTPFPLFRLLSPANSFCLRHFFLDAVSHHTSHLFLALGFDEIE